MAFETIYDSAFLRLEVDRARRVAWLTRTAAPSGGNPLIEIEKLALVLDSLPKSQMSLILDNRPARGRNDDEFEQKVLPVFFKAIKGFAKIGNLAATPVGRLQIQRVTRANLGDVPVFFDEDEARRFVGLID